MRQQGRSSGFDSSSTSDSEQSGVFASLGGHFHTQLRFAVKHISHALLGCCLILYPTLAATDVVPDAGNTETQVTDHGGVPVVDIAAPSNRGVSHNQYETYNVDPQGVVLNNSLTNGTSTLAGAVNANANFSGDSARIILNEVTSTNRSSLLGTTEVFGDNARLIVANPNGITCNGCGFIRTDPVGVTSNLETVMLTTADEITLNGNGARLSLSIDAASQGDILIGPGGINLSTVNVSMLFTRQLQVQGLIGAGNNSLEVLTGTGVLDNNATSLQHGSFEATTSDGNVSLAIDAASVGAMNAGQIYIRATEDGVGVTLDNNLVSTSGDIEITAAGDIVYRNANASGSVNVAGAQITTTGNSIAGQDIRWDMADGGTINAGVDATMTAANDVVFNCTGSNCDVTSQSNLTIDADRVQSDSDIITTAGHDLTVNASVDSSGDLQSGQNLSVTTTGNVTSGNITSSGNTTINAASVSSRDIDSGQQLTITTTSGNIDAGTGTLNSAGNMLLRTEGNGADLLTNGITSGGTLTWQLEGDTQQRGNMSATGDINLECITAVAGCSVTNSSALAISAANLMISAADISVANDFTINANLSTDSALQSGRNLSIIASNGDISSTALLQAAQDISLTSVTGGNILLDGDVNVGGDLILRGGGHYLHDDVGNTSVAGEIDIDIFSMTNDAILNASDLTNRVFRVNQLTNNGLIQSDSALTVQVDDILNNNGVITSLQGVVNINDSTGGNTGLINNNGIITAVNLTQNQSASSTLMINTQPLIAAHIAAILNGELRGAQDLTDAINAANLEVVSQLTVDTGVLGALNIHANTFNNRVDGQIAANEILLDGQNINNIGGLIAAAGNLSVTANNFSNTNDGDTFGVVTARHNIDIDLDNQFSNQGIVEATDIAISAPVQNNSASSLLLTSLEGVNLTTAGVMDSIGAQSWFQARPAEAYYYQYIQALDGDPMIITDTTDLTDAFLADAGANTGGLPIVGDDVFLAELVASTVRQRGGLPYVTEDRNNVAQLRTLYDNTLAYMAQIGLAFGETPTAAQRQNMSQPILVFSQQTLAGGATVLTPTVLMPNAGVGNNQVLASQLSSRIEAHNDMLLEGEQITNTSNLLAGNNLIIEAVDLTQSADARNWYVDANGEVQYSSPMISATNVAVSLSGDYVQRGGQLVAGESLSLQAKNIDVGAAQRPRWSSWGYRVPLVKVFAKDSLFKLAAMRAGVADEPAIVSKGDVYLEAEDKLNFRGKLDAGKSTTLLAGNLNLNSARVKSGGSIYMQADDIRLSNSRISGQDDTYLLANKGNINSINSRLDTTGDMILSAEESITLKNSRLNAYKKADEREQDSSRKHRHEDDDSSGGNLTLLADNGDIINEAGDIYAENSGYMKAGGDIINRSVQTVRNNATTTSSRQYRRRYERNSDYDYFGGWMTETRVEKSTTESQRVDTDVASIRVGEGGLVQIAGGDIENLGGVISSQGDIYQQAEGSILNKTLTRNYLKQRTTTTDQRAYGYGYNFYNPFSSYFNRARQANADVTTEYGIAVQTAEIDAAGNLYQDAGGDIVNQAGRLAAGKTLAQSAKGDIKNLSLDIASSRTTRRKPVSQQTRSNISGCGLFGCGWQRQNLYASNGNVKRNRYGVLIETTNETENQLLLAETSAGEDLIINAEGDYINRGNISAGNDLQIYAKDIENIRMTRRLADGTRSVANPLRRNWLFGRSATINASVSGQREVLDTGRMNAGGDILMVASGDITDTAGRYKAGGDIQMAADGDIKLNAIKWTEKEKTGFWIATSEKTTSHVVTSNLNADGNVVMQAKGDLRLQGTDVKAGESIALAGEQIDLEAVQKTNQSYRRSGATEIRRTVRNDVVKLDAGGSIHIDAEGDLNSYGSQLTAGSEDSPGNLIINAGGDMNLLAVYDEDYYYYKKKKSGWFSSSTTIREDQSIRSQGTKLTAKGGSLLMNVGFGEGGEIETLDSGDINFVGTDIQVDGDAIIAAEGDVNAYAAVDFEYHKKSKSSSSWFGLSSSSSGSISREQLLRASNLESLEGDLSLLSGNNITIAASNLSSGGDINLQAYNDVLITAGEQLSQHDEWDVSGGLFHNGDLYGLDEIRSGDSTSEFIASELIAGRDINITAGRATVIGSLLAAGNDINAVTDVGDITVQAAANVSDSYEYEKHISVSLADFVTGMTDVDSWMSTDNGQLTFKLATAQYDEIDSKTGEVTNQSSLLQANNNINLDSAGDILIEGSTLIADADAEDNPGGDLNLLADGNVIIQEAKDRIDNKTKETHGTAEVSVVVQHQAVEVVKAVEQVKDAKDQLKQANEDYRQYQKDLKRQKDNLADLEEAYANNEPGVSYADILELREWIEDSEGDEAWYQAGIAAAALNLTSKTTLLVQQTAAAAQSTATYGFNAGVQLDIDATRTNTETNQTISVASYLEGNNINISTGRSGAAGAKEASVTTIQGSHLNAANNLNVNTGDLNVLASMDTYQSGTQTEHGHITVAQTVWGAAGGPTVNANFDRSKNSDRSTTYNNSTLSATNIQLTTTGDANISGANVHATENLRADIGGDLLVESRQNRSSGSNNSMGISGGFGFGGTEASQKNHQVSSLGENSGSVSSVNGGINASNGRYSNRETVLTTLTSGGTAEITVGGHTQVNGAMVATVDEDNNDLGNLKLSTNTFGYEDLSNTSYSTSQSAGITTSIGLSGPDQKASAAEQQQTGQGGDVKLNTSSVQYSNSSSYSKTKTMATLGQGTLQINDTENSDDLARLNRDTTQTNRDLFSIDRQQGNIDMTVDTRLFTEDGRKAIGEDMERSKRLGQAIADVALLDTYELQDTLAHIDETQKELDVQKAFALANGGKNIEDLQGATSTIEDKQKAIALYAQIYADTFGVSIDQANIIATSKIIAGSAYTNKDLAIISINDNAQRNATDYANTMGHEVTHVRVAQGKTRDRGSNALNEEYADNMGSYAADGMEFSSYNYNDVRLDRNAVTNTHVRTERDKTLLAKNNATYQATIREAKKGNGKVDYRQFYKKEARLLDMARAKISNDPELTVEEKTIKILQLNAVACAEIKCAEGVPDSDAHYNQLTKLQALGDELKSKNLTLETMLGSLPEDTFDYGFADKVQDGVTRNDELIQRGKGVVDTGLGAAGTVAGTATTIATAPACTTIVGCAAPVAAAAGTAMAAGQMMDGINTMFGDYTSVEGQRVLDSFSVETHQGDRNLVGDAIKDTAMWAGETLLIKKVSKFLPDGWFGKGKGDRPDSNSSQSSRTHSADNDQILDENDIRNSGPTNVRTRAGESGELQSAFAKIEPENIGQGTATNASSRSLARRLGNETDDAGHAIGQNLGGPGGARSGNIFPQAPSVNRGAFNQYEQQIARHVQAGDEVFVRVVPRYNPGSTRPHEILYQARINGRTVSRTFPNP